MAPATGCSGPGPDCWFASRSGKGALPPSWREKRQFTPRSIFPTKMTKAATSNELFTIFAQYKAVVQAGAPMAIDGDDQYSFTPAGTGHMARARSDSSFGLSLSQKYSPHGVHQSFWVIGG